MKNEWTPADVSRVANIIMRAAEKLGWDVDYNIAQTGTHYITCDAEDMEVVIRVANHSDVYCNDTISVDPGFEGVSKEDAVQYLAIKLGKHIPGWVTRNIRKEKELSQKRQLRRKILQKEAIDKDVDRQKRIKAMDEAQRVEYVALTAKLELVRALQSGVDCSKNNRKNKIRKINNRITELLSSVKI